MSVAVTECVRNYSLWVFVLFSSQFLLPARPVGRSSLWEQLRLWVSCLLCPLNTAVPRPPLSPCSQITIYVNSVESFLGWAPRTLCLFVCLSPSTPQPLPRGLHMHESWEESKLWLHQLWQLRLGLPGSLPTHDTRLLGKSLHAGKCSVCLTGGLYVTSCISPQILLYRNIRPHY